MADRPALLDSTMIPRKGAAAEAPAETSAPSPAGLPPRPKAPDRQAMSIRPTRDMHAWLKRTAFESGYSLQDLSDRAFELLKAEVEKR